MLVLVSGLGFMMNPVRTWKISVSLITLFFAYGCVGYLRYVTDKPEMLDLKGILIVLAGLCCAAAFLEIVISRIKGRSVNAILAGTALTLCALLTIPSSVDVFPSRYYCLSEAIERSFRLAISMGPLFCLAAATWVGRRRLENCRVGTEDAADPGEDA